jgi:hypothetical protein
VFTGHGTFSFRPPDDIERGQLKRFYSTDSLAFRFDNIVLLFADTTLVELAAEVKFAPGAIAKDAKGPVRRSLDLLLDAKSKDVNYSVGKTCLEGASNELFLAFVGQKGSSKEFIFEIDPFQTEQVQLWRPVKATMFQYHVRNREIISQFPMEADRARAGFEPGQAPGDSALATADGDCRDFNEAHYRIRSFDGGLNLRGDEDVRFRSSRTARTGSPRRSTLTWTSTPLWENGAAARVYKGDGALLLWVRATPHGERRGSHSRGTTARWRSVTRRVYFTRRPSGTPASCRGGAPPRAEYEHRRLHAGIGRRALHRSAGNTVCDGCGLSHLPVVLHDRCTRSTFCGWTSPTVTVMSEVRQQKRTPGNR